MPKIFISYRRSDSQDVTGRIYDRLIAKFGARLVFKDVDSIPLGVSFPAHLQQVLSKTNVVLVIIGPGWVKATDAAGRRRLDDANDYVRVEIEVALRNHVPVIPVLVSNAQMPLASELPLSLQGLVQRNGAAVRPDPDFNTDMERLFSGLRHLKELLEPQTVEAEATAMAAIPVLTPIPIVTAAPESGIDDVVPIESIADPVAVPKFKSSSGVKKRPRKDDRLGGDVDDDDRDHLPGNGRRPHNGVLIVVVAGASIVLFCIPFVPWVLAGVALILAIREYMSIDRGVTDENGRPLVITGGALAIVGAILGVVSAAINVTLWSFGNFIEP